jgi:hypothetical protein
MPKKPHQLKALSCTKLIDDFDWGLYRDAEKFLLQHINTFLSKNTPAKKLAQRIEANTSTRFADWIDHMVLPVKKSLTNALKTMGYEKITTATPDGTKAYRHKKAIFFPVLVSESDIWELALKPENIDAFVKTFKGKIQVQGKKYAPYRRVVLYAKPGYHLTAVERRGTSAFMVENNGQDIGAYRQALQLFLKRKRTFNDEHKGLLEVDRLIRSVIKTLSPARTADAFFRAERIYWQQRNSIAQYQRQRQDIFGLGWGNHDHHTYRSSRQNFIFLTRICKRLGFSFRERFFAGEMAGWGAQVLEHPDCNIVVFADVDLTKRERDTDFAHKGLKQIQKFGTVGLWVSLHGESILQSGLHHLAGRYYFSRLKRDLNKANFVIMQPFSDFSFLKQAFTKGEPWKVARKRLDSLLRRGILTQDQSNTFSRSGAIGSHLENIQRAQGFKGFNQDSVSAILQATDPRLQK